MSETPEERRERLLDAMWDAYSKGGPEDDPLTICLDALLAALEPPVRTLVERGIVPNKDREIKIPGYQVGPRSEP